MSVYFSQKINVSLFFDMEFFRYFFRVLDEASSSWLKYLYNLYVICSIFLSSHLRGRELKLQLKKCNGFGILKIVICVSRPKSVSFSSLSFLAEAWKQAKTKGTFWPRCTLHFLDDRTNYKAKDIIGKITNLFCIYPFQIQRDQQWLSLLAMKQLKNLGCFFFCYVIGNDWMF
jgi:hypothetical protein